MCFDEIDWCATERHRGDIRSRSDTHDTGSNEILSRQCPVCDRQFEWKRKQCPRQKYCSAKCREQAKYAKWYKPREPTDRVCPGCLNVFAAKWNTKYCCKECQLACKSIARSCGYCGKVFMGVGDVSFCSRTCTNKARFYADPIDEKQANQLRVIRRRECRARACAVRRARHNGVSWRRISRNDVFERDGWVCQICGRECLRGASTQDPASPTLDHVIPLSRGGAHNLNNVRLACWACNSKKRNKLDSEMTHGTPAKTDIRSQGDRIVSKRSPWIVA